MSVLNNFLLSTEFTPYKRVRRRWAVDDFEEASRSKSEEYQVNTVEVQTDEKIDDRDIEAVMYKANVNREQAIKALKESQYDLVDAIMALVIEE